MTSLVIDNGAGVVVEYITDLLKGNSGNFTILQTKDVTTDIVGATDVEKGLGMDLKSLPYNLGEIIELASTNSWKLSRVDIDGTVTTWDYTDSSTSTSASTSI